MAYQNYSQASVSQKTIQENKVNKTLKEGDPYLSIGVDVLGQKFFIAAFPNMDKKKDDEPDYKGKDVAVWIRYKKGQQLVR